MNSTSGYCSVFGTNLCFSGHGTRLCFSGQKFEPTSNIGSARQSSTFTPLLITRDCGELYRVSVYCSDLSDFSVPGDGSVPKFWLEMEQNPRIWQVLVANWTITPNIRSWKVWKVPYIPHVLRRAKYELQNVLSSRNYEWLPRQIRRYLHRKSEVQPGRTEPIQYANSAQTPDPENSNLYPDPMVIFIVLSFPDALAIILRFNSLYRRWYLESSWFWST